MEEAVWVTVGVLSVIIVLGAIGSIAIRAQHADAQAIRVNAAQSLGAFCQQVCEMPLGTHIKRDVTFPAETVVTSVQDTICVTGIESSCVRCPCAFQTKTVLNLTGASSLFASQTYQCFITRNSPNDWNCVA